MKARSLLSLAPLLALASANAQTPPAGGEKPKVVPQMCVIAVGAVAANIADWKSESVFSFKPSDPGATPPMDLVAVKVTKEEKTYVPFPLSLNAPAGPVQVVQSPFVLFRKAGEGKEASYTPALEFPAGTSAMTATILWRDKNKPDWKDPNKIQLDASREAWPEGKVCFLNLSPATVGLTLQTERVRLDPRSSKIVQAKVSEAFPYKIEIAVGGKAVQVCNTATLMRPGERAVIAVYGTQAGGVEATRINVPMPAVEPTEPKTPQPAAGTAGTAATTR